MSLVVHPDKRGGQPRQLRRPAVQPEGEVIGINSQIFSQTGGYQGLSFAVPVEVASKVTDQLVAHGKVTRGRMGVTIQNVNQALAESFGLSKPMGALVSSVEKGSPAEKAGIEPGDVIVNGKNVDNRSNRRRRWRISSPAALRFGEVLVRQVPGIDCHGWGIEGQQVAANNNGQQSLTVGRRSASARCGRAASG
jgi:membrane-associated protease RseP (regulator of RpoE activity)